MALELRPNCEFCDKDLPPNATDARICTYECTFCADCVGTKLHLSLIHIYAAQKKGKLSLKQILTGSRKPASVKSEKLSADKAAERSSPEKSSKNEKLDEKLEGLARVVGEHQMKMFIAKHEETTETVSYTHLDVYKRQV